jgi:hypothetical protein
MMQTESLTLLTTAQASEIVRLSTRTLEGLRGRGGGPIYRKLSGRVFYALSDLVAWIDGHARASTTDPAATSDPGASPEPEVP